MSSASSTLHMLRMRLELPGLVALARRRRLPAQQVDMGYVVHMQLAELFAGEAPQPFHVAGVNGRWATILAYSERSKKDLEEVAQACADPAVYETIDWNRFDAKPMPDAWAEGQCFDFEVRYCPVVRMSSAGAHHRKGAEVDAFLAACWRAGSPSIPVDREDVYRDWLRKRMETSGARALQVALESFKRERVLRRTHGTDRKSRFCERPAAVMTGDLQVTDARAFGALLRRGIGRHRAFGFGMLRLRRRAVERC